MKKLIVLLLLSLTFMCTQHVYSIWVDNRADYLSEKEYIEKHGGKIVKVEQAKGGFYQIFYVDKREK